MPAGDAKGHIVRLDENTRCKSSVGRDQVARESLSVSAHSHFFVQRFCHGTSCVTQRHNVNTSTSTWRAICYMRSAFATRVFIQCEPHETNVTDLLLKQSPSCCFSFLLPKLKQSNQDGWRRRAVTKQYLTTWDESLLDFVALKYDSEHN